jgi:hypothetical protein
MLQHCPSCFFIGPSFNILSLHYAALSCQFLPLNPQYYQPRVTKNPLAEFIRSCLLIVFCFIPTDPLFQVHHVFDLLCFMQPRKYCFVNKETNIIYVTNWGTPWRSWLRHVATRRKVADSIPDGVIGIFHSHNPSGRTMALGSTQTITEISTRNISWGVKGAGA